MKNAFDIQTCTYSVFRMFKHSYLFFIQGAYDNIKLDLDTAVRHNIYFGAKLVRGAYMEQVSVINFLEIEP